MNHDFTEWDICEREVINKSLSILTYKSIEIQFLPIFFLGLRQFFLCQFLFSSIKGSERKSNKVVFFFKIIFSKENFLLNIFSVKKSAKWSFDCVDIFLLKMSLTIRTFMNAIEPNFKLDFTWNCTFGKNVILLLNNSSKIFFKI